MTSLSAQVARAHSQWLNPIDLLYYTQDELDAKCGEINDLLENFSSEWCGGVEESYHVKQTISAANDLIKKLDSLMGDLIDIEENQDPHQENY